MLHLRNLLGMVGKWNSGDVLPHNSRTVDQNLLTAQDWLESYNAPSSERLLKVFDYIFVQTTNFWSMRRWVCNNFETEPCLWGLNVVSSGFVLFLRSEHVKGGRENRPLNPRKNSNEFTACHIEEGIHDAIFIT